MKKWTILLITVVLFSCTKERKDPKLVVFVSIDQMRGDYFSLFNDQFEAGFKTLQTGRVYDDVHHYHSKTVTAAGHATLATGCYPSSHGIINNYVYNRLEERSHYSIEDTTIKIVGNPSSELPLVSSKRLMRPTFGDILKENDTNTRVYSLAIKDRAAILMGGKKCNRAFWFDAQIQQMVSSSFYTEEFPSWVADYTARSVVGKDIDTGWYPEANFEPIDAFTSSDTLAQENDYFHSYFPHTKSTFFKEKAKSNPDGNMLLFTPFGDKYILEFAKKLIDEKKLGQGSGTDLLNIGLSAADIIGHHFGPNSYEVLDYYNKVDFYIQSLIDHLDKSLGKENYLLVLSSDHGVSPIPEAESKTGASKRIGHGQFDNDMANISSAVQAEFGLAKSLLKNASYAGIEPELGEATQKGVDSFAIVQALTERIKDLPYIREAYSSYDVADSSCDKPFIDYYKHSQYPNYGYMIQFIPEEFYLVDFRDHGTTHGTPYTYDTHVPFVMYGNDLKKDHRKKKYYTVDIVPTMLEYLGIETDHNFDGQPMK